ncbi:TMV resistance protein N-like isoform X2 [Vigna unguiculata]|uniref:TMV resistance protein N-like isoform X2 n=1 Tax=Vigna unguiculata TaxID=3917 RepID=UPI0010160092|nr:TMV resistance protein N-like isoform X2 [Vigna unguiculata]
MRAITVGLQSRVEDVMQIINNKSTKVCIIGIGGREGSGKTTLAKAIYNTIHGTFMEKSFIKDIAQVSQTRGHVPLQEQLLSDVLKTKVEIRSVEMGSRMIREILSVKRMLIVLDDMIEKGSPFLDLIRKSGTWFGAGTVIIMTTKEEGLLSMREVDFVFRIKLMNPNESLELLSWHAFREAKPKEEYNDLAKGIVTRCQGLPLALEVIGSYLYERTKEEWNRIFLKLDKIPMLREVDGIFTISFDGLGNQMEKYLFLDLCSSFMGKGRASATNILNNCGLDADSGIRVLIERNLIHVERNNKLGMHPLLQKMGMEIIFDIPRKEPEVVWFDRDAEYARSENTGTKVIHRLPGKMFFSRRDFFKPYPLEVRDPSRLLKLAEDSEYLSKKLRRINLQGFSQEYIPNAFYLHDAIVINLKHSHLRFFWKQPQDLTWLKVLNLSHSKYLMETPDFSRLPSLEQLILKDCPGLCEVHQSIGCLNNLILLNLKDCTSLSNLPIEIYKLKSLKTLILCGCSKVDLLERDILKMESLIILIAQNTTVKQVPFSIVSSQSIGYISLRRFQGLSHNLFPSIIRFRMPPTLNPQSYIHSFMNVEDNIWHDIAPFLSNLAHLRSVLVQYDAEFQLSKQVKAILVEYGVNITEPGILKHQFRSSLIGVGRYRELFNMYQVLASSELSDVSLPGDNNPYWLAHMGEGDSVSFTVPQDRVMKGMALSVVYLSTSKTIEPEFTSVFIVNYTKCTCQIHNHDTVISFNDEDWHGIISNLESGDKVEIFVTVVHGLVAKNTVVYLIYGESNDFEKVPEPKKNSLVRFIKKIAI